MTTSCHRAGGYDMLTGGQPESDWDLDPGLLSPDSGPASEDLSPVTSSVGMWGRGVGTLATIGPAFRQYYRLFSPASTEKEYKFVFTSSSAN